MRGFREAPAWLPVDYWGAVASHRSENAIYYLCLSTCTSSAWREICHSIVAAGRNVFSSVIGVGIPSPSIPLFCPGFPVALVGVEELRARHFVIVLGSLAVETTGFAGTSAHDLGNRDVI